MKPVELVRSGMALGEAGFSFTMLGTNNGDRGEEDVGMWELTPVEVAALWYIWRTRQVDQSGQSEKEHKMRRIAVYQKVEEETPGG